MNDFSKKSKEIKMYKCQICNEVSESRERINKIIVNKRNKEYYIATFRHKRNIGRMIKYTPPTREELEKLKKQDWELISEKETKGWEIVQEIEVCRKCYGQSVTQKEEMEKK